MRIYFITKPLNGFGPYSFGDIRFFFIDFPKTIRRIHCEKILAGGMQQGDLV